ncbi:hypothetical protein GGF50DRAFT_25191, partial [Schizophyllum commune]
ANDGGSEVLDKLLSSLAKDLDIEEETMPDVDDVADGNEGASVDDIDVPDEALPDLTAEEQQDLKTSLQPIKFMLVKLRKLAFKIINSSTILLPAWKEILTELGLRIKLLPRDVRTRWNSTYDMLVSALEHRDAIDKMFKN